MKEVTKFIWSRSYVLKNKENRPYFFSIVTRQGADITFELRDKDNHCQVSGTVFVPDGEEREVFGFEWNGKTEFLMADNYIARGLKGRHTEDGKAQLLVGDEWVDYGQHLQALKLMDEKFK